MTMPRDSIEPFGKFLERTRSARHENYSRSTGSRVRDPAAFEEQRKHILSLYQGVAAAHSFVDSGGQIFDCIPVRQQRSLRGSNEEVAQPPILPKGVQAQATQDIVPLLHPLRLGRFDRYGNEMACPPGTVPIRRVTLEEVTRFETLGHYQRKRGAPRLRRLAAAIAPEAEGAEEAQPHEYAYCSQSVANLGGHSFLNVWAPPIAVNQIFSLSQHWYSATGSAGTQTAECGWQVYPQLYGHSKPVLFSYWTADGYENTGSYSATSGDFVQVGTTCPLGIALDDFSSTDGTQAEIELAYHLADGKWWLFVNGTDQQHAVGYYPGALYQGGPMANAASSIEYGGETDGRGSYPPMGSGAFASAGYGKAAYQRNIYYFSVVTGGPSAAALAPIQQWPSSYTIDVKSTPEWGEYFYFGGPGGAASAAAPLLPRAPGDTITARPIADANKPLLPSKKSVGVVGLALVAAGVADPFAVYWFKGFASAGPLYPWLVALALVFVLFITLGLAIEGYPFGVLVDGRNKISLSRLQIVLWTILFVATFWILYIWNVSHAAAGQLGSALRFTVPSTVWLLMGISGTSAVGAPLILSAKPSPGPTAPPPPAPQDPSKFLDGVVVKRQLGAKPSWADILLGDEAGNADSLDISKLQQLMLSAVAFIAYAYAVGRCLLSVGNGTVPALPEMDGGFIALIAASHATYLGYKAASHSN
jgi:hypothetical protein